jgi:hypothetical protein
MINNQIAHNMSQSSFNSQGPIGRVISAPGTTVELNMPNGYQNPIHLSAGRRLGSIGGGSNFGAGSTVA